LVIIGVGLLSSIEGKIEGRVKVMGRLGRRSKELMDDLKEKYMLETGRGCTISHSV